LVVACHSICPPDACLLRDSKADHQNAASRILAGKRNLLLAGFLLWMICVGRKLKIIAAGPFPKQYCLSILLC
jgi:hypothetical protein